MGMPAARAGDPHVCPMFTGDTAHVGGPIAEGDATVLVNGRPAARVGDRASCCGPPDSIAGGAARVLVGGRPLAHVGSTTAHGGVVRTGSPDVLVG